MNFAHDTQESLRTLAALVNTADDANDADDAEAGGLGNPDHGDLDRDDLDRDDLDRDDLDRLRDVAALEEFLREWGFTGRVDGDDAELQAVRRLRTRLRGFFDLTQEELAQAVNALLREGRAMPQVVRHDHWGWHLHATDPEQPLVTRMAVEIAMALVDVLRADETDRLRRCEAPDCSGVLVDLSRNRSRRFCSTACGNRVAAAAYRARRGQGT